MIDSKDLRLNNWVEYLDEVYRVHGIKYEPLASAKYRVILLPAGYGKMINWINPIPLTHKILTENCGFDFIKYNHLQKHWAVKHNSKLFEFHSYEDKSGFYYESSLCDFELRSLNQLQNLFYALTGQELEVKF